MTLVWQGRWTSSAAGCLPRRARDLFGAVCGLLRPLPRTSTSSSTSSAATAPGGSAVTGTGAPAHPGWGGGPAPATAAHEDAEKTVTGAIADRARAAAVKALGGGTAGAVTTTYRGDGYEVTVTKTDGTSTVVHLTSALQVMTAPSGGPGMGGRPGGEAPTGAPPSGF